MNAHQKIFRACLYALLACLPLFALANEPPSKLVKQGNDAYREGDFQAAEAYYTKAAEAAPDASEITFDRGLAAAAQDQHEAARDFLLNALATHDPALEAKTKYNLGCLRVDQATAALERPVSPPAPGAQPVVPAGDNIAGMETALKHLATGVRYFKDALDVQPENIDARVNIEAAVRMYQELKKKLEQAKQQQKQDQDSDQEQQNKDQEKDQEKNKDQDSQSQDKGAQDQPPQDEDKQQDEQSKPSPEDTDEQTEETPSQEDGEGEPRELSREDVERLLQAVKEREQQQREEMRKLMVPSNGVEKDW